MSSYPTEATYDLWIPRDTRQVAKGTPLIARPPELPDGNMIHAYYEEPGNYANVTTFAHRIIQAAGRLHDRYPTSKLQGFYLDDVVHVGRIGYRVGLNWVITEFTDLASLIEWDPGPHFLGGSPSARYERDSKNTMRLLNL